MGSTEESSHVVELMACAMFVLILLHGTSLRANERTNGDCSPIVAETAGSVIVNVSCNLSQNQKKEVALSNIEIVMRDLRRLVESKNEYFLPSLAEYVAKPSATNWTIVIHEAGRQLKTVDAAIDSAEIYEAGLDSQDNNNLQRLHNNLRVRVNKLISLQDVPASPLPDPTMVRHWQSDYSELIYDLVNGLYSLKNELEANR